MAPTVRILFIGITVSADALRYYRLSIYAVASTLGDVPQAMAALALIYSRGGGVPHPQSSACLRGREVEGGGGFEGKESEE